MGIPTHFIRRLNMREQLIREVEIIPLEVVVRNVAAGSLAEAARHRGRHGAAALDHRVLLQGRRARRSRWSRRSTSPPSAGRARRRSTTSWRCAIRVNDFLSGLFLGVGIQLVDFKIECGRLFEGDMMRIVVADEISPGFLPAVGRGDQRQARQGPLPPRHGRAGRGLSGSRPPPRHHERERAAAADRAGAGRRQWHGPKGTKHWPSTRRRSCQ